MRSHQKRKIQKYPYSAAKRIIDHSNEYIIGTPQGVVKTPHTPKRKSPEEQWSADKLHNVTGTPWNPVTTSNSFRIPTNIKDGRPEYGEDEERKGTKIDEEEKIKEVDEPEQFGMPTQVSEDMPIQTIPEKQHLVLLQSVQDSLGQLHLIYF